MSESAPAAIPTDYFTSAGFVKSCGQSSHPRPGDIVVIDGNMYTVKQLSWDYDTGGMPLLVRINLED
jgi:hypothetical protein